jgi:hypothetical protein
MIIMYICSVPALRSPFLLNGVHVGVAAADENVVDDDFFGAHAFHGIHEIVAVGYERSASDFDEALFEVTAGLLL